MKKHSIIFGCGIVFLLTAVLFTGCWSSPSSQSQGRQSYNNLQWTFLDPVDVVGKKLTGSDENGDYSFLLNEDGTLEYTVNGTINAGEWAFDDSITMYRYTFDWTENGTEQGYIMDFMQDGAKIAIIGHWYLTDAYLTFHKDVAFEE
jgi:hypothetical protein